MERFTEDLLFIVIVLLVAAILGYLIAYLIYRRKIKDLELEVDDLKKRIDELEKKNESLIKKNKKLESDLENCKENSKKLTDEITRLKSEKKIKNSTSTPVQNFASTTKEPKMNFNSDEAKKTMGHYVKKDDLTLIEGIGPKIQDLLRNKGIDTWYKLSESKKETIEQILHDGGEGFRLHDPTSWPAQAKLAFSGEWDKLKTMQDDLFGGRIVE